MWGTSKWEKASLGGSMNLSELVPKWRMGSMGSSVGRPTQDRCLPKLPVLPILFEFSEIGGIRLRTLWARTAYSGPKRAFRDSVLSEPAEPGAELLAKTGECFTLRRSDCTPRLSELDFLFGCPEQAEFSRYSQNPTLSEIPASPTQFNTITIVAPHDGRRVQLCQETSCESQSPEATVRQGFS